MEQTMNSNEETSGMSELDSILAKISEMMKTGRVDLEDYKASMSGDQDVSVPEEGMAGMITEMGGGQK